MLIEITGVNGAGKSTIKNKIISNYKGALLDDSSVLLHKWFSARIVRCFYWLDTVAGFKLPYKFLRAVTRYGGKKGYTLDETAAFFIAKHWALMKAYPFNTIQISNIVKSFDAICLARELSLFSIHDEGPSKKGLTLIRHELIDLHELKSFYDLCKKPDVLIVLKVSQASQLERLAQRETKSEVITRMSSNYIKSIAALDCCVEVYRKAGVHIIEANAENSPDEIAKAVLEELCRFKK